MKLIIATTAAALLSTAAIADESTRYNDLRLDTSNSAITDDVRPTDLDRSQRGQDQRYVNGTEAAAITTRNSAASPRDSYDTPVSAYLNGGHGPQR